MYSLRVTEYAENDLDDIIDYIAHKLANPSAASALLDAIDDCYWHLRCTPYMYGECADTRLKAQGYRRVVIKNYVMIYKIDEAEKTVIVLRFFYGSRDYQRLL